MNEEVTSPENTLATGNLNILVTRPIHQASGFSRLLENNAGITAVRLPTLEISFVEANTEKALQSDIIIFTSVNAVVGAQRCARLPWACKGKTAAIGAATASALQAHGVTVDWQPHKGAGSEALLELLGQSNTEGLEGSKVTIVCGNPAREKLPNSLSDAGVFVENLVVYERKLPNYTPSQLEQVFESGLPDIISVTSDLGLINLLKIVPAELQAALKTLPLVTNSARCEDLARENGFSAEIAVAKPPGDEGQVTEILRLASQLAI